MPSTDSHLQSAQSVSAATDSAASSTATDPSAVDNSQPNQPRIDFPTVIISGQKRCFKAEWFDNWTWLDWDSQECNVKCHTCRMAVKLKLITFSKNADCAFTESGFKNWKKATERFTDHERSNTHREAQLKYMAYIQNEDVRARLQEQYRLANEQATVALHKMMESIRYLARQGLAIQGLESDSGNLMELSKLRSADIPELANWLKRKTTWTSHDIQNEILQIMAHKIQRDIASDIQDAAWFSLIVDETTDISVKEQVSICLRYVSKPYEVHEDFVGFYETSLTDAATLEKIIEDVLMRLNISLKNCRGQCYDGASCMAGRLSGVQARLLEKCDKAIYVHCCAHSLNLAIQDATRAVPLIRDVLDLVRELNNVVRASAKRHALFDKIRSDLALAEDHNVKSSLRQLCPTRWTVRATSMQSVMDNYNAILAALEEIASTDKTESGSKASGLCTSFTTFQTYFALNLGVAVFSRAENLSCLMQKKKTNATVAKSAADVLYENLQHMRSDDPAVCIVLGAYNNNC